MSIFINGYGLNVASARPWIGGVCAALAGTLGVEPWIIRLVAAGLLLWHPLWIAALYLMMAAFIRNGRSPIGRRLHWFSRHDPASPREGDGLSSLARQLAALDRRLSSLEATISESDYTLRQKFRNL